MKRAEVLSKRVKLQHLKVVAAVAQCGSMAKAARQLAISQPVVSKVIADIEDLLEVRLFDRTSHGVTPTLYGRSLLKRSVSIFDDIKTCIEEISFLSNPAVGELRVGSTEPLLAGLVTATIERVWDQYPGISLRVTQADSLTLIDRELLDRRIELAVIPFQRPLNRDELEVTVLYQDFWHVVASTKSKWTRRRKITLNELVHEPWCATPLDTAIGSLLIEPFRARGLEAPRLAVASVLSPQLVVRLLETGRLVAVMADSLLNYFFAKQFPIRKLPVDLPTQPFNVAIVTVKNRTISPLAQNFVDCARDVARQLEKSRSSLAGARTQ
jgi:DNA-binding transcriptional LysR family regulator